MAGLMDRLRPGERGQTLVEAALVLPVLLLLLAGVVDLGRGYQHYIVIADAARAGARYGSRLPNDQSGIVAAVREQAMEGGLPAESVSVSVEGLGAPTGQPIQVTATYTFSTILGGVLGPPTLTVSSSTQMVVFGLDG